VSRRTEDAWRELHRAFVVLGRIEAAVFAVGVTDAETVRRIRMLLLDHDPDGVRLGIRQLQMYEFMVDPPRQ
jgi:hypothetical protein